MTATTQQREQPVMTLEPRPARPVRPFRPWSGAAALVSTSASWPLALLCSGPLAVVVTAIAAIASVVLAMIHLVWLLGWLGRELDVALAPWPSVFESLAEIVVSGRTTLSRLRWPSPEERRRSHDRTPAGRSTVHAVAGDRPPPHPTGRSPNPPQAPAGDALVAAGAS